MLDISNNTHYTAGIYPGYDRRGKKQFTVVVKSSYSFDTTGKLQQITAEPLIEQDEWRAQPNISSLKAASETMPFKKGAELLLQGNITPPHPHYHLMDVCLSLQTGEHQWQKPLRVFGNRQWQRHHLKATMTYPKSLTSMELSYENAFGGECAAKQKRYPFNPAGRGYHTRDNVAFSTHLPNIEYKNSLIRSPRQKVKPAGYGPIPLQWTPRNTMVPEGIWHTFKQGRYPEPTDLPENFYNTAPEDQQFLKPFTGGEMLGLKGLIAGVSLTQTLLLQAPQQNPICAVVTHQAQHTLSLCRDTYHIDINKKILNIIWRATMGTDAVSANNSILTINTGDISA